MSLPPALSGNLATLVVAFHFTFLVFVTAGGFLLFRWPRVAWLHVPCFLWGGYIELTGGICPLTPLENSLRRAAGGAEYAGSFIEHYLVPILYPSGLTRTIQVGLGVGLLVLNVGIYALVIRRWRSRADSAAASTN